jgi:exosortase
MKRNEDIEETEDDGGDWHAEGGRPLTPLVLGLVALVGFGPLVAQFFANLWNFDTYQFFPLALAGAGVLAWRGLKEAERPLEGGSAWLTVPMLFVSLVLLAGAAVMWSPWIGMAAFLVAVLAAAWWLGGWGLFKAVFPAWVMVVTVMPPPLKFDERFALQLQEWATIGSSRVLGLLGIPHFLSGLVIEIPGQRLLVEEACSGINSVLFMTSACVFYAMWKRRGVFFLAAMYAVTIGCVLAGNLFRITVGAWALFHYKIDLFVGWKHEAIGLVMTATYLGCIVASEAVLGWLFRPRHPLARTERVEGDPAEVLQGRVFGGGLKFTAVLLALLCAVQLVRGWDFHFNKVQSRMVNPEWMDGSAKFSIPRDLNGWRLAGEERPVPKKAAFEDGVFSHIWQYQRGGMIATISFDYPFFHYHDVRVCYKNSGWEVGEAKLQRASAENGMMPCMEVALSRENGVKADLFFSTVDEAGDWLEEPGGKSPLSEAGTGTYLQEGTFRERLMHRFNLLKKSAEMEDPSMNYRVQVLAAARGGLGEAQRREVETLFREARILLASQFVKPSATPTPTPKVVEDLAPLPSGTMDATRKAIEDAKKAAESAGEGIVDPTRKAIEDARKVAEEGGAQVMDATRRAIEEAKKEAEAKLAAEEQAKREKAAKEKAAQP